MIEIKELNNQEIIKHSNIIQASFDIMGEYVGLYYKLIINNREKILQRANDRFIIYTQNDNNIDCETFTINEDYTLKDVAFEEYELQQIDSQNLFQNLNNNFYEYLTFVKRQNGVDNDGFNGLITYVQYDPKNETRAIITYQQNSNNTDNSHTIIYPCHLQQPFQYSIETKIGKRDKGLKLYGSLKEFIRINFNSNYNLNAYNLLTIKEYGLLNFLKKGAYALQKNDSIHRYCKILHQTSTHQAITLFPFCKCYTQEEMEKIFINNGFKTEIPQFLLDYYNNQGCPKMELYQDIANQMKEIEQDVTNEIITLKFN